MLTPQEQETPGTALRAAESRYEPLRGSPAIGHAAFAVRRVSSLFTVAPLVDGAGGYLFAFALILGRDFPNSRCGRDFRTSVSAKGTCAWEAVLSEGGSLQADETGYLLSRC
jgi:hypothetical protein